MDLSMLRDDQWARIEGLCSGKASERRHGAQQSAVRRGRTVVRLPPKNGRHEVVF